jgi:hypothetical protein
MLKAWQNNGATFVCICFVLRGDSLQCVSICRHTALPSSEWVETLVLYPTARPSILLCHRRPSTKFIMAQRRLRENPPKSYHVPPLKTVVLWRRAVAPRNLILSQHCHQFYCGTPRLPPKFRIFHLTATNFCTPDGGQWLYSPPIRRLWIYLNPSGDIKIVNNPIKTRHVKTKTDIMKSTIIYIQLISTHHLQFHNILFHSLPLHLKIR